MLIKSQAKYIQTLSHKKFRDDENAFVAEGPKIINELLTAANVETLNLFALRNWIDDNAETIKKLKPDQIIDLKESELERISFLQTPNQVLAVFKKPFFGKPSFEKKITILLDGIQDPGNLGTIIRTADWFGIENIICSKDSADIFNPKVVQSTMGSISRIQVLYEDLKTFIDEHPSITVYATSLNGKNLFELDKIDEGFILFGNESKGVNDDLLSLAKEKITIPKTGNAESLNAAVAAGIVMAFLSEPRF